MPQLSSTKHVEVLGPLTDYFHGKGVDELPRLVDELPRLAAQNLIVLPQGPRIRPSDDQAPRAADGRAHASPAFPTLVGREQEVELIGTFIRDAAVRGEALLLAGDMGVGKSLLLDVAAERAQAAGTRVLRAAGAEFEASVGFSTLGQLLHPVLGALARASHHGPLSRLSPLHGAALLGALGWSESPPPDQLVLWNAALALIRAIAADQPVLMVVDDLQWADPGSAEVLGFAARRLRGSQAGFIGAIRSGEENFFDQAGLPVREVRRLDDAASAALLDSRFPALAPSVRRRLLAEAEGNPLALLELTLPLTDEQRRACSALPAVLPLTSRLLSTFATRLADLPEPTRQLLLLAALDGTGELGVLEAAAQRSADDLAPAERARLVRFDEARRRLVFRHPLVRSAVVEQSTIDERRRAHCTLADLAELAARQEQQALHLAAAATGPDMRVARMLENSAHNTLRRGDPAGAVRMLLRAADLSPDQHDRRRQMAEAAYVDVFVTGNLHEAGEMLEAARRAAPGDCLRAATSSAQVLLMSEGKLEAAHRLLTTAIDAALDASGDETPAEEEMLSDAMRTLMLVCRVSGRTELWHAYYGLLARIRPQPPCLVSLEATLLADPARSMAADLTELDMRISTLQEETHPSAIIRISAIGTYVDRVADCRDALSRLARDVRTGSAVTIGVSAATQLAGQDFREGLWTQAEKLADEGFAMSEAHGFHYLGWLHMSVHALLAACRGEKQKVRTLTGAMSGWAAPRGAQELLHSAAHARALAAIGQGDFEEAYRQAAAISPPGTFALLVPHALRVPLELVEAAVRTGRHAEAAAHADAMRETGLPAISPRLAFLTAGAAAIARPHDALFEAALASPGAHRWPFELARIRLAYGEHLRRSRARTRASEQLAAALEAFDGLGATPWSARARSELRACGMTRTSGTGEELSPREHEIAALAASGLTNKQIGEQLYLSPRTVGDHLHKIFPKLGISTRAALRDALSEKPSSVRDLLKSERTRVTRDREASTWTGRP